MRNREGLWALAAVLSMGLLWAGPLRAADELMLSDFESAQNMKVIEGRSKIELVPDHATQGKLSGKAPGGFVLVAGEWTNLPADWSAFDELCLDVFNPGPAVKVSLWVGDGTENNDYYGRHNNSLNLPEGATTLTIPVGGMFRGEKGSGKFVDPKAIKQMVITFPAGADGYYLDNFRLVKGGGGLKATLLIGFEDGEKAQAKWAIEDWPEDKPGKSTAAAVAEHAAQGQKALKFDFRENGSAIVLSDVPADWSGYDVLAIDCFNPTDKSVEVSGWFRDEDSKDGDYWQRHNYKMNVQPGQSTIEFPIGGLYRGEKGSGKFLDTRKMHSMCLATAGVTLFLDNVRMIKGTAEVAVDGLRKFDLGPQNSPNFPGFTAVHPQSLYAAEKGFGWVSDKGLDGRNYEQPDSLICDFIRVNDGQQFAVDLPNGKYVVQVMLDIPSYWDYVQFNKRAIEANGKEVVSEKMTNEQFLKDHFFRFEDTEDLPGMDIWQKYVGDVFKPKSFEAEVTSGKLELTFRGDSWGLTPSFIVVYPAAQAEAGGKWMQQLDERRKKAFKSTYSEVVRKPENGTVIMSDRTPSFVLFARGLDKQVSYNSAPGGDPSDTQDLKIDLAACPGEYESYSFSVYPMADCGQLSLAISDFSSEDGAKIPASAMQQRAIRYKMKRIGGRITNSYEYLPWLLVDFKTWPIPANVTRQFWLTLHVPADAKAGKYSGKVTVSLAGQTREIPVSLQVYPFALDEPKMSIGMYGGAQPSGVAGIWNKQLLNDVFQLQKRIEEVLRDQKEHGMTAVTPPAPAFLGFKDGKAQFNFEQADAFMAMLRKLGYHHECFTYANMFRVTEGDVEQDCQKKYGMALEPAIKLAYEELGKHMKEANWLPMAWALADEPLIHSISAETVIKVFTAHRKAAPQMQFVSEDAMGEPSHYVVIPAIDIVSGNTPRYQVAQEVKKNKGRYWYNNIGTDRLTFGWYLLKSNKDLGVEALFQWGYSTNTGNIFYDLDGSEGDSGCSFTTSQGQRARREWEMIREGADDHRYVQTLLNLIAKADASDDAALKDKAQAARKFIDSVFSKIDLESKKSAYINADLEGFKRQAAAYIFELKALVK